MRYCGNKVQDVKIAYIGGGSRGWAWGLMSDLVSQSDMEGSVYLYDIDFEAAKNNEIIGNKTSYAQGAKSEWKYIAVETIKEALEGADFTIVSILLTRCSRMCMNLKNTAYISLSEIRQGRAEYSALCVQFRCMWKLRKR